MPKFKEIKKAGDALIAQIESSEFDVPQLAALNAQNLGPGFCGVLITHDGKADAGVVLQCAFSEIAEFFADLFEGEGFDGKLAVFLDNQPIYFSGRAFHPVSASVIELAVSKVIAASGNVVSYIYIVD